LQALVVDVDDQGLIERQYVDKLVDLQSNCTTPSLRSTGGGIDLRDPAAAREISAEDVFE
jgi:hypothetical protein